VKGLGKIQGVGHEREALVMSGGWEKRRSLKREILRDEKR